MKTLTFTTDPNRAARLLQSLLYLHTDSFLKSSKDFIS